ncbi:hypothetical protein D3C87_2123570 [compost metagenome]
MVGLELFHRADEKGHALDAEQRVNTDLLADVDIGHFNQAIAHGGQLVRALEA